MTLATTKSSQGGYETTNRGTQTYPFTGIWGFLAETQPKLEDLLQWTVVGGETWVCLFEPCSKWQSMEWKHVMPPNTKYWNSRPLQIKWSCYCFLYWNGPRLEHFLDQGTTITAASYTGVLKSKLKPAIHYKCRGLLSKGSFLCCVSTSSSIPQQLPPKQSDSCNLIFSHAFHIVST
jgi:hypothetical protein